MKDFYLFKSGRLKRKGNTVYFTYEENGEKINRSLPLESINGLFAFGEIDINSKALIFLSQNKIPVHFFNYYGFYSGSFMPRKYLPSGFLLVKQVQTYLKDSARLNIAREFVSGAVHNTIKNLIHYEKQDKNVSDTITSIKELEKRLLSIANIQELMAIEGNVKDRYYGAFEHFLGEEFKLDKRVRRPPNNMINCLVSFGNSLLYTTCLSEIYHTQLEPTISFLHEPGVSRFSLSLDIAEVFKPIIVDKVIFKLVNNNMIKDSDFLKELNYVYMNERGRRLFLEQYEERMNQTIMHNRLKRHVSYKRLIRLECYKLIKHLVEDEPYTSFKMLW